MVSWSESVLINRQGFNLNGECSCYIIIIFFSLFMVVLAVVEGMGEGEVTVSCSDVVVTCG